MPASTAQRLIWLSVPALLLAFGATTLASDPGRAAVGFTQALVLATVAVEILAWIGSVKARRVFAPDDTGHRTWTLIAVFLAVRIVAELRAITLVFQLVPAWIQDDPDRAFFYRVILRYLFTVSDLILIAALVTMIRAYRSTGLQFAVLRRDWAYMAAVCAFPLAATVFRTNLFKLEYANDPTIATYRLVAVFVGAAIVCLCLVVRRYVVQMGGGALARIWTAVVVAGIARAGSFVVLALLSGAWWLGAGFLEQLLLWIFACHWLLAARHQAQLVGRH